MSGSLVAGLDAGLIYNEFPLMGGRIVPNDLLRLEPAWKNFFDNPSAVQFDHRILAESTAAAVLGLYVYSRRLPLPKHVVTAVSLLGGMAIVQVSLGITTLIYFVPIPLASSHQAGSVALLTFSMYLLHTLKVLPK